VKVLVFGAGALGSFVGGLLSEDNDVTLVGRKRHVDEINSNGLSIEGKTNRKVKPRALESVPNENFDLVIATVKSYDTQQFVKSISQVLKSNAIILSLQNGIGNVEKISEGCAKVLGGTTSHGITFVGNGRIRHTGFGDTTIGNFKGVESDVVQDISKLFADTGIDTQTSNNISGEIWAKAIINTSINPLTAVTRLENGYLVKVKELKDIMVGAAKEAIEVATSSGIELPCYDIAEKAVKIATLTADNKSSMLQDVERGKRTEIDSITGGFVEIARTNGVSIPINSLLYTLVKSPVTGESTQTK
jgi:2-dehydropantoate 2-reductase